MSSEGVRKSGAFVHVGRRNVWQAFQNSNPNRHNIRPAVGKNDGHRGPSRHRWWRGPREPPYPIRGPLSCGVFSLFVDGIGRSVTLSELRELFEEVGVVADTYISGKKRRNTRDSFGFVRFYREDEANMAVKQFDGAGFHGSMLKVSMAKYYKGGQPICNPKKFANPLAQYPVLRDHRRSSVGLVGKSKVPTSSRHQQNSAPSQVSLKIYKNHVIAKNLKYAIVIEDEKFLDGLNVIELISMSNIPVKCVSSLSPVKILLFLEDEVNVKVALDKNSPLRQLFQSVRIWTDDECFIERTVWLECHGIHPKCWSHGNLKVIGSIWGKTLKIEHVRYGSKSITSARILVRTSSHKRIDECVKIQWESGSCELWVKELVGYDGKLEGLPNHEISMEEDPCNCDEDDERVLVNNENNDKTGGWNNFGSLQYIETFREGRSAVNACFETHEVNGVENMALCVQDDANAAVEIRQAEKESDCVITGTHADNVPVYGNDGTVDDSLGVQQSASVSQKDRKQGMIPGLLGNEDEEGCHFSVECNLGSLQCEDLDADRCCFGVNKKTPERRVDGKRWERQEEGSVDTHGNDEIELFYVENQTVVNCVGNGKKHLFLEDQQLLALTDTGNVEDKFDPIASVEVPVSLHNNRNFLESGRSTLTPCSMLRQNSVPQKRPRGRPKRIVHSLPEPLFVPSTPTKSNQEAIDTWNTAKLLGIKSNNEGEVISALRKSKRLLILEGNKTTE
ncbi:unnamed protein product [Amaranthus hypochondriacus]